MPGAVTSRSIFGPYWLAKIDEPLAGEKKAHPLVNGPQMIQAEKRQSGSLKQKAQEGAGLGWRWTTVE